MIITDDRCVTIQFIDPNILIPTEDTEPGRVEEVEQEILSAGSWKHPVLAHADGIFVMDGHHRRVVARRQRLKLLPVIFLRYTEMDVFPWRAGDMITPEIIFDMVRKGRIFPSKTTRHVARIPIPQCDISLTQLRSGSIGSMI